MKDAIERLLEHREWANVVILQALRTQPDDEALALQAHVLGAEHVWLSRIHGQPSRHAVWPLLSLDECERLAEENRQRFRDLLAANDDAGLRRSVTYRNSAGREFVDTVEDILLHVAMHGQHHRGQIARGLRALGATPPYTDFILFARRDQPGGTLDAANVRGGAVR